MKLYKRIAIYAIGTTTVTNVCPPVNLLLEVTVKLTRISAQVASGVKLATAACAPPRVRANAHTTRATTEIVQVMETSQFADATGPLTKMPVMQKLLV